MFTWVCPKCGREVSPSMRECPSCKPVEKPIDTGEQTAVSFRPEGSPTPRTDAPVPQAHDPEPPMFRQQQAQAPQVPPPLPQQHVVQQQMPAGPILNKRTVSPTLAAAAAFVIIGGCLAFLYLFILPRSADAPAVSGSSSSSLINAAAGTQTVHPLAKHLELTGVRVSQTGRGFATLQFLVVNHSGADLPDLKMNVVLRSKTGDEVFQFPVDVPSIGPYEFRDLTKTISTQMKPYEIPDWQLLRPEFSVSEQL